MRSTLISNIVVFLVVMFIMTLMALGLSHMFAPLNMEAQQINLNLSSLPEYALRTSMRFIIAMLVTIVFGLVYAVLAAKNKRIAALLIPLLDIFQSVPVLGYLSFSVTAFVAMAPGNVIGVEMAIIFAIFTAQVWNVILSIYQSLTTVPQDLYDASQIYRLNKWQVFWRVELPFAIPGIVWNMILSISSSWFFVVASEAISVGAQSYTLPGLGVYIAIALKNADITAICYAMLAILIVINLFNNLLFAPLVAWSHKFRYEFNTGTGNTKSWLFDRFISSTIFRFPVRFASKIGEYFLQIKLPVCINKNMRQIGYVVETIWWSMVAYCFFVIIVQLNSLFTNHISLMEILDVIKLGFFTAVRVLSMLLLSTIIWVPIGIYISMRPVLIARIQPLLQFLTAIPANIYFPVFVIVIMHFKLNPEIWLSLMMVIGAQWYVLYNILAGGQSIPTELLEAAQNFKLTGWAKWKKMLLPAIFPYYITGIMTASGGAWNASIVAEIITWGNDVVAATGLGAYIISNTNSGDFAKITIGVIIMSAYVTIINHILWRPLSRYAAKEFRLD